MKKTIKILSILLPIILLILIILFISADIVTGFENWAYSESVERMSPFLTSIMKVITHMGDAICVMGICLIIFAIPKLRKDYAIPVSIVIVISAVLNIILKNIFVRERPDILRLINETGYSFPSGHAMNNMALYSIIAFLTYQYIKNKKIRNFVMIYCAIIILLIGFSRIYLGVHYITDVIAGWCFGFLIASTVYHLWNKRITLNKI